jgi:hypothetical protein
MKGQPHSDDINPTFLLGKNKKIIRKDTSQKRFNNHKNIFIASRVWQFDNTSLSKNFLGRHYLLSRRPST